MHSIAMCLDRVSEATTSSRPSRPRSTMYYAVSTDAKTWSLQKLGQGTWLLNACPMDGGGLALDSKSVVHSVWRRDASVYATSGTGKEVEVGRGKNPSIAVGQDGPYVS